jgi:FtsH-binding integral membrane protein
MKIRFKLPSNFDKQIAAQVVLVILFLLLCFWISVQPNPFEAQEAFPPPPNGQTGPINPGQQAASATAYQLEIEGNRNQTTGIVFGGSMLIVLIISGTLLVINKH